RRSCERSRRVAERLARCRPPAWPRSLRPHGKRERAGARSYASVDLDTPPLRALLERQRDAQDAVAHFGLATIRFRALRQRNAAIERAVAALSHLVALLLRAFGALLLTLTGKDQPILVDVDLHILLAHTREIGAHYDRVVAPLHVDTRRP